MLGCEIVEKSKIASRARAPGRRNPHSSSSPGKPDTWQRGVGDPDGWNVEECEMQTAETLLAIYGERGRHGKPLEGVYRQLFNPELYLRAYYRLAKNEGAMTRGKVQVHHIRKLSDLKVKGQREKPTWLKVMSAMRRKTLIVCERCHVAIHAGRPTRTHEDQEEPIKG